MARPVRAQPAARLVATAAERAAQIASDEPEDGDGLPGRPGLGDHGPSLGVGADHHPGGGQPTRRGHAPWLALADGRSATASGSVQAGVGPWRPASIGSDGPSALVRILPRTPPTRRPPRPRNRRLGRLPGRPAPVAVVGRHVTELAQKVDQLLHVADEVAPGDLLVGDQRLGGSSTRRPSRSARAMNSGVGPAW